jgi:hypothetical protein
MKQKSLNTLIIRLRICIAAFILAALSIFLFSFTARKLSEDFFKLLGIEKSTADRIITNSLLGGYFDAYGFRNAKNVATGNRAAVAKDMLDYSKKYTGTDAFKNEYSSLKERNKPELRKIQTPGEMQKDMIEKYRKSISDLENTIEKSDAATKPVFENILAEIKKQLKNAEDPASEWNANYAASYGQMLETNRQVYEQQLKDWEIKYPSDVTLFVKQRLIQFIEVTKDIDFSAELADKNGKKVFVNPRYEQKNNYWKMAFRAGKEVVEPARDFVQKWLNEIK